MRVAQVLVPWAGLAGPGVNLGQFYPEKHQYDVLSGFLYLNVNGKEEGEVRRWLRSVILEHASRSRGITLQPSHSEVQQKHSLLSPGGITWESCSQLRKLSCEGHEMHLRNARRWAREAREGALPELTFCAVTEAHKAMVRTLLGCVWHTATLLGTHVTSTACVCGRAQQPLVALTSFHGLTGIPWQGLAQGWQSEPEPALSPPALATLNQPTKSPTTGASTPPALLAGWDPLRTQAIVTLRWKTLNSCLFCSADPMKQRKQPLDGVKTIPLLLPHCSRLKFNTFNNPTVTQPTSASELRLKP